MAESYPTVNGHEYSFARIELRWNDKRYVGFKSIDYDHEVDVEAAVGSATDGLGWPEGEYKGFSGTLAILRRTHVQMLADMGEGYMAKVFDIAVSRAPEGSPVITDDLVRCRLVKEGFKSERGSGADYVEVGIKGLQLRPNGVKPMPNMLD